jgi:phosphatidylserine/phosphatidylglycerophosphate/cardiolipin synthase-like enzyme
MTKFHFSSSLDAYVPEDAPKRNSTVITGTANWSTSSSDKYDEDWHMWVSDKAPQVVSSFRSEFGTLWAASKSCPCTTNSTIETPNTLVPADLSPLPGTASASEVFFTSGNYIINNTRSTFTPRIDDAKDGVAARQILAAIRSADEEILIAHTFFRFDAILEELLRALSRGVRIEVIHDGKEKAAGDNWGPLERAGAKVILQILGHSSCVTRP